MLCYWLVDNYDPTTNSLRVRDQRLAVTRKMVHEIYQIPMGDIPMSNPSKANPENNIVRISKSQFENSIQRIRLTHVIDKIRNDTEAGPIFVLNFLVMFVSVMIGFTSMGTVNQGFLENIRDDVDINRLDWCGFVVSCLNSSRMMWKRLLPKCVFTGPTAFLLLFYLHFTRLGDATKVIPTNGLTYWTTHMLKERESYELSNGGFGNVLIASQDTDMLQTEKVNGVPNGSFQSETYRVDGATTDSVLQTPQHNEDNNLEKVLFEINNNFIGYHNAMKSIGEWLHEELDDVVQPTPFTQILIAEALDNIEKSALVTLEERRKNECATPNQRDSNVQIEELKAPHLPVVAPRRTQRLVQLIDKLRSPNFSRVIDPNTVLKLLEERVSGCIFTGLDSECYRHMGKFPKPSRTI